MQSHFEVGIGLQYVKQGRGQGSPCNPCSRYFPCCFDTTSDTIRRFILVHSFGEFQFIIWGMNYKIHDAGVCGQDSSQLDRKEAEHPRWDQVKNSLHDIFCDPSVPARPHDPTSLQPPRIAPLWGTDYGDISHSKHNYPYL